VMITIPLRERIDMNQKLASVSATTGQIDGPNGRL
jgi:hypothetical protein